MPILPSVLQFFQVAFVLRGQCVDLMDDAVHLPRHGPSLGGVKKFQAWTGKVEGVPYLTMITGWLFHPLRSSPHVGWEITKHCNR
jgi:hypothetical protein